MLKSKCLKATSILGLLLLASFAQKSIALTANQVAFEFRPNGLYRIYLHYTIPALKEFREAYVEFAGRKEAESFYFKVLRGAEFYLDDPKDIRFVNEPLAPEPW